MPNLFLQNVIAMVWDFDKTLIPTYMQQPLFDYFNVDAVQFWKEVNALPEFHRANGLDLVSKDTLYLNHILTYVRNGIFKGLNNRLLRELGGRLYFYPGIPNFLASVKKSIEQNGQFAKEEIKVEHYIVSTGIRQMILGSKIAEYIDGVWACEFVEKVPPPGYLEAEQESLFPDPHSIVDIGYVIDNTTKTRAIFEINKGTNKNPKIDVNASIAQEDRRVPFQNMIYIADGPSDIPVFSIINQYGGKTFAVYMESEKREFAQVNRLQEQGRVQSIGPANYTDGSQTSLWILNAVEEIAARIAQDRGRALGERVAPPPDHLT